VEQFAGRRDEIDREEVVDRETEPPLEPSHPAAEREPSHPRVTDDADRARETERLRLTIELAEERPAVHLRRPSRGIDAHTPHQGQVDHDAVVAGRETADAVTAGPDRDRQVLLASEADRADDVIHAFATSDDRRSAVDHPVPHDPGGVVARASGQHDLALERLAERRQRGHAHRGRRLAPHGSTGCHTGRHAVRIRTVGRPDGVPPPPRGVGLSIGFVPARIGKSVT
jgi:hypothetical protein